MEYTIFDCPLFSKYYSLSPYLYCGNNPVLYLDIDGLDWYQENGLYLYSPDVHSGKDLKKGQIYMGSSFTTGKGSNLATYNNDGSVIRLLVPELTEETRKTIVKNVKKTGEESKVALRSIRKDANDKIKALKKDGELTEDETKKAEDEVQKITDNFVKEIDKIVIAKEKEIMSV